MQLDDLIYQTGEWLKGTGPHSDIVMSSRVTIRRIYASRNLFSLSVAATFLIICSFEIGILIIIVCAVS